MAQATGRCFKCNERVPHENLNKFYCSEECRLNAYQNHINSKFEKFKSINFSKDWDEEELKFEFENWLRYN